MITYPVDVANSRWTVYRLSTNEIVGRNKLWPRADGMEIQGQDPDYVYLLQTVMERPGYDARIYSLEGTETVDVENNAITTTWSTVKRPVEDLIVAAENEESRRLSEITTLEREQVETRLIVTAILSILDNEQLPQKIRDLADDYKRRGVKIHQNRDRLDAIKADVTNGLDPDLDAGWADPEPDTLPVVAAGVATSVKKA